MSGIECDRGYDEVSDTGRAHCCQACPEQVPDLTSPQSRIRHFALPGVALRTSHSTHHITSHRARHLENPPILRIRTGSRYRRTLGRALRNVALREIYRKQIGVVSMQRLVRPAVKSEEGRASKNSEYPLRPSRYPA